MEVKLGFGGAKGPARRMRRRQFQEDRRHFQAEFWLLGEKQAEITFTVGFMPIGKA
jgi:hypothetical protein